MYAFVTRLSRVVIGCVLVLSAADVAAAQTLTANGTTGAFSINRGDTVTISTSGSATNWVGLFPVGAGNSNFLQYVYLNGSVLSVCNFAKGATATDFCQV